MTLEDTFNVQRADNNDDDDDDDDDRIYIAPYSRNFRGAGGRSDRCSVQA